MVLYSLRAYSFHMDRYVTIGPGVVVANPEYLGRQHEKSTPPEVTEEILRGLANPGVGQVQRLVRNAHVGSVCEDPAIQGLGQKFLNGPDQTRVQMFLMTYGQRLLLGEGNSVWAQYRFLADGAGITDELASLGLMRRETFTEPQINPLEPDRTSVFLMYLNDQRRARRT